MSTRKYELMLALKPSLPENVRLNIQNKIENIVKDNSLGIKNQEVWGKKYFAFDVKKHNEGYFILYNLEQEKDFRGENISKLQRSLFLIGEIIRQGIFSVKEFSDPQKKLNS